MRNYKLIHDGPLQWRFGKNKAVDLHVVLLEDLLILLTRTSDSNRLVLRFHNINLISGREDKKYTHCPVLKLTGLLPKNVATGIHSYSFTCRYRNRNRNREHQLYTTYRDP